MKLPGVMHLNAFIIQPCPFIAAGMEGLVMIGIAYHASHRFTFAQDSQR